MTIDELLAAAEALPLDEHQQAVVRMSTAYHRRLRECARARREAECNHQYESVEDTARGWHRARCRLCGAERTYESGG